MERIDKRYFDDDFFDDQVIDTVYSKTNLKNGDTIYMDKMKNNIYAISQDENLLKLFTTRKEAKEFFDNL